MNILVTGGCGFIGTHLCALLLDRGHFVVCLDKMTYAANEAEAMRLSDNENYRLKVGDCRDDALVGILLREYRIDAVMHLAAESHVDRSISGPQTFLEANVLGTYGVLEAVRSYLPDAPDGFRLLHVSTDEVFGDLPLVGIGHFEETSAYRPSSPYSVSKASSDWLVRAWGRTYGVPWVMTHGANTYGPGQLPDKLVPMAIVRGLRGEPITIHGTGANVRSWLYVADHAEGLVQVLLSGHTYNNYCLEDGTELTNLAVVDKISQSLRRRGFTADLWHIPDRPGNDLRYSMASSKVRMHTTWRPRVWFDEGLESTIDWYVQKESQDALQDR